MCKVCWVRWWLGAADVPARLLSEWLAFSPLEAGTWGYDRNIDCKDSMGIALQRCHRGQAFLSLCFDLSQGPSLRSARLTLDPSFPHVHHSLMSILTPHQYCSILRISHIQKRQSSQRGWRRPLSQGCETDAYLTNLPFKNQAPLNCPGWACRKWGFYGCSLYLWHGFFPLIAKGFF